jgi:hypothetical protein
MKYKLVSGGTPRDLERDVNMYLQDGWLPIGSPIFTPGRYYQALTLEEKKETE